MDERRRRSYDPPEEVYHGWARQDTRELLMQLLVNQHRMEHRIMGALEDALAAEDTVIQQVVALIQALPNVAELQAQLAAANEAVAVIQADHDIDATALTDALASIATGVETVAMHTGQLQALVPVVEPPVV